MEDLLSKCGANCGRCPSYRENLITDEDRQRCSAGWQKYHGFRLRPEKLLRCDGCLMPISENPVRCYIAKLDEEYGRGAFRYFAKADMRVLSSG